VALYKIDDEMKMGCKESKLIRNNPEKEIIKVAGLVI
jgi:hypothetical protein